MAGSALIGNLAVTLGLDTAAFQKGATLAEKQLSQFSKKMQGFGASMQKVGKSLSTYVTLPLVGIGAAGIKMAGDFEAAMNGVSIATSATGKDFEAMRDLALDIGKSTVFGASQAAGAMEDLAKIGLTTEQILGGAAEAAANLAAAVGSELEPAAIAVADTLQQFKMNVEDLPRVVDQITGAVNLSKLSFEDYQLAIGQAGGVAGALGVSFEDFNAVIAGTSALFASGSDAGTSFKTFLTRLVPQTKQAAAMMAEYNLSFFDAQGNMRSMAEVAENLRTSLGGLSEEAKTEVLKKIFGTDAMRTAIGLMDQGAAGLDKIKKAIEETDAAAQSAKRMEGFNAQMKELGGAFETLAIRVADAGMLTAITGLVTGLAGFISVLSDVDPLILQIVTALAALAAAAGPVIYVVGTMIKLFAGVKVLALFAAGLTGIGTASGVAATGATAAGIAFRALLGPIGLAITAATALYLAWKNWDKISGIVSNMAKRVVSTLDGELKAGLERAKVRVQKVKEAFRDMYDKVVGNSYVPDMVDGISHHFGRLQEEMVKPAKVATAEIVRAFGDTAAYAISDFGYAFADAVTGTKSLADSFSDMAKSIISDLIAMTTRFLIFRAISGIFGGGSGLMNNAGGLPSGWGGANPTAGPIGMASGGTGIFGGLSGIDKNVLSLNGSPIARVSKGEHFSVSPANDRAANDVTINQHYAFSGVAVTKDEFVQGLMYAKHDTIAALKDMNRRGR